MFVKSLCTKTVVWLAEKDIDSLSDGIISLEDWHRYELYTKHLASRLETNSIVLGFFLLALSRQLHTMTVFTVKVENVISHTLRLPHLGRLCSWHELSNWHTNCWWPTCVSFEKKLKKTFRFRRYCRETKCASGIMAPYASLLLAYIFEEKKNPFVRDL